MILTKRQLAEKARIQKAISIICPTVFVPYDVAKMLVSYISPLDRQMLYLATFCQIDIKHKMLYKYLTPELYWTIDPDLWEERNWSPLRALPSSEVVAYYSGFRKDVTRLGFVLLRGLKLHRAEWVRFFEGVQYESLNTFGIGRLIWLHRKLCPHVMLPDVMLVSSAEYSRVWNEKDIDYLLNNRSGRRAIPRGFFKAVMAKKHLGYLKRILNENKLTFTMKQLHECVLSEWKEGYNLFFERYPALRYRLPDEYFEYMNKKTKGSLGALHYGANFDFPKSIRWILANTHDRMNPNLVVGFDNYNGSGMLVTIPQLSFYYDVGGPVSVQHVIDIIRCSGDEESAYFQILLDRDVKFETHCVTVYNLVVNSFLNPQKFDHERRWQQFQKRIVALKTLEIHPTVDVCRSLAKSGLLEVLQFVRQSGFPWDSSVTLFADMHGHSELADWARENGCP